MLPYSVYNIVLLAIITIASATGCLSGCYRDFKGNKNGFTTQLRGIIPASQPTGQIQLGKACKGNLNRPLGADVKACDDVSPTVFVKYDLATANIYRKGSLQNAVTVNATVYCRIYSRRSSVLKSVKNDQKPSTEEVVTETNSQSNIIETSTDSHKTELFKKGTQVDHQISEVKSDNEQNVEDGVNGNQTVKADSSTKVTQIPVTEKSDQTKDTTEYQNKTTQATQSDQTVTENQTFQESGSSKSNTN